MKDKFVGIQVGPQALYDEGIDNALDLMQETAGVNALFAFTHTYYGANNRAAEVLAPDHGITQQDERGRKLPGLWVTHHDEHFRGTSLRHKRSTPDYDYWDRDILADLAEPARKRGMKLYARFLEPHQRRSMQFIDNWSQVLAIDVYGRIHATPCFNNPDYKNFWIATTEDLFKTYPLDGLQYGSERCGPLSRVLFWNDVPTCFCNHCVARGKERGINTDKARQGFQVLYEYVQGLKAGKESPVDGALPVFLRIILQYPEILAWEQMAHESKEDLAKQLYGTVKVIRPDAEFGIHVDHQESTWDIFQRAEIDYAEMVKYCDFLKPIAYHDIAGPRIKNWYLGEMHSSFMRDASLENMLASFYDIMGYDKKVEPAYDELETKGLSVDYVYRLTRRLVEGVGNQIPVYPGIGFDVPKENRHFPADPADVCKAVEKAFEAGAAGIVLSREYDEMRLNSLKAVGQALRSM